PPSRGEPEGWCATHAKAPVVTKNTTAAHFVARDRKLAAPAEPNTLPAEPLPKAAPMSAPLPCCSRTSTMIKSEETTWRVKRNGDSHCMIRGLRASGGRYVQEFVGHERGPAHQRTVNVRLREQAGGVVRLDAATIQNTDVSRTLLVQGLPDESMDGLRLFRRCR